MRVIETPLTRTRRLEETVRLRWLDGKPGPSRPPRLHLELLAAIVILAAALRLSTLGVRSYWVDEAIVVRLTQIPLPDMLRELVTGREGTPPLYYTLAWFWAKAFGTGEFSFRLLPAIFGTGAVPIAYLAGREIISSRAGLVASTLFALSPVLVWHSQDARAHSLAVLLSGVSFLFFVRALRQPGKSTLAAWAAFSALGLFTHYFVALLAGVEAAWLLLAFPVRRVRVAVAAVVLAAIPAGAIALAQKSQSVDASYALFAGPLSKRLVTVPAQLLVGEQPPLQLLTPFLAALLILPALWVLARGENTSERWGALIPGIVAGAGLALSVVGAVLGFDYLIPRNVLPFWVPVVLVVAIGFSASRAPRFVPLAGVALCLLWGSINVITADKPKFDREDWRGAADALGAARSARAIVVTPQTGQGPLQVYLPRTRRPKGGIRVREIDVVGLAPIVRKVGVTPTPPRPAAGPLPPPGFREVERRQARYYTIVRFEAPEPVKLDRPQVVKARLSNARPGVLLQSSADRSSTGSAATGSRYVSRSGR